MFNGLTGANENAFVVDNTAPGVEISGVPETSTAAFTATITFSEGVNGFAVEDIAVGNGSGLGFTGSDGDTEFTALITPERRTVRSRGERHDRDVAADAAADAAGNGNTVTPPRGSPTRPAIRPPTIRTGRRRYLARQSPASSPTDADADPGG